MTDDPKPILKGYNAAYLFTSGFDGRIISARDAIRALKRRDAPLESK